MSMHGHNGSTNVPLLQKSVAAMQINQTLTGIVHAEDKIVQVRTRACVALCGR